MQTVLFSLCVASAWSLSRLHPVILEPILSLFVRLRLLCNRKEREILLANLAHCFNVTPHSRVAFAIARDNLYHQSLPLLLTLRCVLRPKTVTIEGLELLQEITRSVEAQGHGGIIVTAHLGSWEYVANAAIQTCNRRFVALAKPAKLDGVQRFLDWMRRRQGIELIDADAASVLKKMCRVLAAKDWLGFVMDQKPQGRKGPVVKFFGHQTPFVAGPALMAKRFSVPIVPVFVVGVGVDRLRVFTMPTLKASDCAKLSVEQLTQILASRIEEAIKLYPEQWSWNYKRWRWSTT